MVRYKLIKGKSGKGWLETWAGGKEGGGKEVGGGKKGGRSETGGLNTRRNERIMENSGMGWMGVRGRKGKGKANKRRGKQEGEGKRGEKDIGSEEEGE